MRTGTHGFTVVSAVGVAVAFTDACSVSVTDADVRRADR